MCNVTFFKKDLSGRLRRLPWSASLELILNADSATLKLENQKNGWHGMCFNHEWNVDNIFDMVRTLARWYFHIQQHMGDNWETFLSAVFTNGQWSDIINNNIRHVLKFAAA
jgi:hypothetical protein